MKFLTFKSLFFLLFTSTSPVFAHLEDFYDICEAALAARSFIGRIGTTIPQAQRPLDKSGIALNRSSLQKGERYEREVKPHQPRTEFDSMTFRTNTNEAKSEGEAFDRIIFLSHPFLAETSSKLTLREFLDYCQSLASVYIKKLELLSPDSQRNFNVSFYWIAELQKHWKRISELSLGQIERKSPLSELELKSRKAELREKVVPIFEQLRHLQPKLRDNVRRKSSGDIKSYREVEKAGTDKSFTPIAGPTPANPPSTPQSPRKRFNLSRRKSTDISSFQEVIKEVQDAQPSKPPRPIPPPRADLPPPRADLPPQAQLDGTQSLGSNHLRPNASFQFARRTQSADVVGSSSSLSHSGTKPQILLRLRSALGRTDHENAPSPPNSARRPQTTILPALVQFDS